MATTRKLPAEKKKAARKPTAASASKPSSKAQVAAKKKVNEPEAKPTVRIVDFWWKTSNRVVGYFTAEFDDNGETILIGVKEMLYDFPKEGLEFRIGRQETCHGQCLYHPTIKNTAYGCNFCYCAMCGPFAKTIMKPCSAQAIQG